MKILKREFKNIKDIDKVEQITDLFSDVVFEKILHNITHLVKIEPNKIFAFKCEANEIHLNCIETNDQTFDFTTEQGLTKLNQSPPSDLNGFKASKSYKNTREQELFNMMENGCSIHNENWYVTLSEMIN